MKMNNNRATKTSYHIHPVQLYHSMLRHVVRITRYTCLYMGIGLLCKIYANTHIYHINALIVLLTSTR